MGGSLDGAGDAEKGYSLRGGRMFTTDNYECTWQLFKDIPSLIHPNKSVFEETVEFNEKHRSNAMARLVDRRRAKVPVTSMGFSMQDRMELLKLSQASEESLGDSCITDWLSPAFFSSEFWLMWATTFAFQPWHSAIEFKRYLHRFMLEFTRIDTLAGVKRTVYNQYDSLVLPLQTWLQAKGVKLVPNCKVIALDHKTDNGSFSVTGLHCQREGESEFIEVTAGDVVFLQNASMTDASSLGSMSAPPAKLTKAGSGGWKLWESLASERPQFRGHLRCEGDYVHDEEKAAALHPRVQGAGCPVGAHERQEPRAGREGAGPDGDSGPRVGAAGGDRREARSERPADERGACRDDAAQARAEDGDDGARFFRTSCRLLREQEEVSFDLVKAEEANYPKALMCRALGVSRSGHHAFSTRGPSPRALGRQQLDVLVAAIFAEFDRHYGAPRIERELRKRGHRTSRKSVAASMIRQGLVARRPRRWRTTTDSSHKQPLAPNVLHRDFTAPEPDRVWVADTTYLPVVAGFIFLCVAIDLYSRKVVGWAVSDHLDAALSSETLRRALVARSPRPGLIFHSDRGSEFAAGDFRDVLASVRAVQSMSRRGNCWDNAPAESFFSTLEFEGPHDSTWRTAADAEPALFTFIEAYYNSRRLHSTNDYRSPNDTEADWRRGALAA